MFASLSQKIGFVFVNQFCILKPWSIISNLIRFELGFWQASKPFYRKLKYSQQVFEELQCLSHFPGKMVLYSSTNFRILKPRAIISSLIRLDLGFWQASESFYRQLKYREKIFEEFQNLLRFPRKMFCIRQPIFAF